MRINLSRYEIPRLNSQVFRTNSDRLVFRNDWLQELFLLKSSNIKLELSLSDYKKKRLLFLFLRCLLQGLQYIWLM